MTELDEMRAELAEVSRAIGSVRFMDPPDGGSVSLGEQVRRMRETLERVESALTPSGETKAAYWGEFAFPVAYENEDGDTVVEMKSVPWTTIKEIMAAILEHSDGHKVPNLGTQSPTNRPTTARHDQKPEPAKADETS